MDYAGRGAKWIILSPSSLSYNWRMQIFWIATVCIRLSIDKTRLYFFTWRPSRFVPTSWGSPAVTLEVNIVGSANVFEAVRQVGIDPVIQIACSSEEYGLVHENEVPIKETNPLRPLSPYAVSKVAMDYLGYQVFSILQHAHYQNQRVLTTPVLGAAIHSLSRRLPSKSHSSKKANRSR